MNTNSKDLSRAEKILLFIYEYAAGNKTKIRYEDIVVGVFKKHPHDFQLKGYPEYPDSGDLIHKPLYDFKKRGYINAANKVFSLTDRGIELAQQLQVKDGGAPQQTNDRLSRSSASEVSRIKNLEGFELFAQNDSVKLSDNDFYNYLGVTVRTQKNSFLGRLATMNSTRDELALQKGEPVYDLIVKYHDFLTAKHADIIAFFSKN